MKHEVIIYWSKDDNSFIAEVPELPGCITDGKSYIDAVENVQTIMSQWIETASPWDVIFLSQKGN